MTAEVYRLRNVEQSYGARTVLRIDALEVQRGSIVGFVGPNGSGKSTLLRLLTFMEKPSSGDLFFEGLPAAQVSEAVRRRVSLLLQDPSLLKRTVFDNVAYGLKVRNDRADLSKRVGEALNWVGLSLDDFGRRPWYALSGGEAQRVALASRLILRPEVLALDEPTSSVDAASAALIREAAVRARNEWGTTLLIASHDWAWLEDVADGVAHLVEGRLAGVGIINVIPGPWEREGAEVCVRRLSDGQSIRVAPPPHSGALAVLDPRAVRIERRRPEGASGENLLEARLISLQFQRKSLEVVAGLDLAGLSLKACLPTAEEDDDSAFRPGRTVWIAFAPQAVRWV
jgi:tungstate transport system ATP-binding protein